MSQQEDKPAMMEARTEKAVKERPKMKRSEESVNEESTGWITVGPTPTPEPAAGGRVMLKTFYCSCRDCKLYFGKGNPVECVNPNIVEMRYPKWNFPNNSGANKAPVFRRPADPDTRKDLKKVKRSKK